MMRWSLGLGLAWLLLGCANPPARAGAPGPTATIPAWANPTVAASQDAHAVGTPCSGALSAVQQYKAPGDATPVLTHIQQNLAAERRPVQVGNWSSTSIGNTCQVRLTATIGNERHEYLWTYSPDTRSVRAPDDATKRISGW